MVYYISAAQLFQIFTQSLDAIDVTSVTLSCLNSINAINVTRCHESERTCLLGSAIFFLVHRKFEDLKTQPAELIIIHNSREMLGSYNWQLFQLIQGGKSDEKNTNTRTQIVNSMLA